MLTLFILFSHNLSFLNIEPKQHFIYKIVKIQSKLFYKSISSYILQILIFDLIKILKKK